MNEDMYHLFISDSRFIYHQRRALMVLDPKLTTCENSSHMTQILVPRSQSTP